MSFNEGTFEYPASWDDNVSSEDEDDNTLRIEVVSPKNDGTTEQAEKQEKKRRQLVIDYLRTRSGFHGATVTSAVQNEDGGIRISGVHTRGPESPDEIPYSTEFSPSEVKQARTKLFPLEDTNRIV